MKTTHFACIIVISLLSLLSSPPVHAQCGNDAPKLSFAFVGDFQIGAPGWIATRTENPSSTNIPQLRQTMYDLSQQKRDLKFGFLIGDLVLGEADDQGQALQVELDAWQAVFQGLTKPSSMRLIPVAGNHEIDAYKASINAQVPSTYAYGVWLDWLSRSGYRRYTGNGPKPLGSNPDHLVMDESRMTYSFNVDNVHFVVINTDSLSTELDPATGQAYPGWIPLQWLRKDIVAAQRNSAISSIFVIGHSPIEESASGASAGATILNTTTFPLASRLAATLTKNKKVRAYFCSHLHVWEALRLQNGKGAWQIIAGNGGAPLVSTWNPAGGQYFGYTTVDVCRNGEVKVSNYARPVPPAPQLFYQDSPIAPSPAVLKSRITIKSR